MDIFAVFVVIELKPGVVAATTRAADRGEAGKIGLPGGKVDAGETPREALIRESREEGWLISNVDEEPFFITMVNGKPVAWFRGKDATKLTEYKEKHRGIMPIEVSLEKISKSGYCNDVAISSYKKLFKGE